MVGRSRWIRIRGLVPRLELAMSRQRLNLTERDLVRRLEGVLNHLGGRYIRETTSRLERIVKIRTDLAKDVEAVLRGEPFAAEAAKDRLDQLELELRGFRTPERFLTEQLPAVGADAAAAATAGTERLLRAQAFGAAEPVTDHPLRLENLRALAAPDRAVVERAGQRAADMVRRAVDAEKETGLTQALADLERQLRADPDARMTPADLARLRSTLVRLNGSHPRARSDRPGSLGEQVDRRRYKAAAAAIADPALRSAVLASPWLQRMAFESMEQVADLWSRYGAEPNRKYSFRRYVFYDRRLIRGTHGEYQAAFNLGERFIVLKAPKSEVTVRGTDLIALDLDTGRVLVIDNKAYGFSEVVRDVSALTDNLWTNLGEDARYLQRALSGAGATPPVHAALTRLRAAVRAVDNDPRLAVLDPESPQARAIVAEVVSQHGIDLVVTAEGGRVTRLADQLRQLGLELRELTSREGGL